MERCEKASVRGRVVAHQGLGASVHRLTVEVPADVAAPGAAQFYMLRPFDEALPFLPRAFSVSRFRRADESLHLDFLIKVYGTGTAWLCDRRPGDSLRVTGPLGIGYDLGGDFDRVVLVAGGIGLAPFPATIDAVRERTSTRPIRLIYGGRKAEDLVGLDDSSWEGVEMDFATEDGSRGHKGFVTHALKHLIETGGCGPRDLVLACGPNAMLGAVASLTMPAGIPTQVAMEEAMACGFGVCNGCAIRVVDSKGEFGIYERVCVDGPVFDAKRIDWPELASIHG